MNAPSEDVKDMLEAESALALTYATNLFIGKEPSAPNNCATIFDTPGFAPDISIDGTTYYRPSIQIRVRNNHYLTGWSLINNIKVTLHGKAHETWNGTIYEVIMCSTEPALLDWDENRKARFVVNFNIQRR